MNKYPLSGVVLYDVVLFDWKIYVRSFRSSYDLTLKLIKVEVDLCRSSDDHFLKLVELRG